MAELLGRPIGEASCGQISPHVPVAMALRRFGRLIAVCALSVVACSAWAQGAGQGTGPATSFSAADRDINRFLDAEKPDPAALAAVQARANQPPPPGLLSAPLARFLLARAQSKREAGLLVEAIADAELAVRTGVGTDFNAVRAKIFAGIVMLELGSQSRRALAVFTAVEKEADRPGEKGALFAARRGIVQASLALGDRRRAEQALARSRALLREARAWPPYGEFGLMWEAEVEAAAFALAMHADDFEQAEQAARRSELLARRAAARPGQPEWRAGSLSLAEAMTLGQARAKTGLGRLAEAETDVRGVLIARIQRAGRHQHAVLGPLSQLRHIKIQQGRYADALEFNRRIFETFAALNVPATGRGHVAALNQQALVLARMNRRAEVEATHAEIDRLTESWDEQAKLTARSQTHRFNFLANTGRGMEAAEPTARLVERLTSRFGENDSRTAYARSIFANILVRTGKVQEGLAEFRRALPILADNDRLERDDLDAGGTDGLDSTLRTAVLNFLYAVSLDAGRDAALIDEAFRYGEMVRPDAVQKALTASSLRAAGRDPRLGPLVRSEQDAAKAFAKAVTALQAALEEPSDQRDAAALALLRAEVDRARKQRAALAADLARRFPQYSELVAPVAPSLAEVQKILRPREAFVSIMVGVGGSFVWVIPQSGPPLYYRADLGRARTGELVERVRKGLDASAPTLLDVPAFDVLAASTLYNAFLKPAEAAIEASDSLIVATVGRLSGLPFGLLPRRLPDLDLDAEPVFSGYRAIPWLIRTHAVSVLPSAASLRTLRQAAAAGPRRASFIGFGDPIFGPETQEAGASLPPEATTRGLRPAQLSFRNAPTRSGAAAAALADLQRLPDTADELQAIAATLGAPAAGGGSDAKVLLRADASERQVRQAKLSDYRVVAFATHGLRAGEIAGLSSPALALSAPGAPTSDDDGLLTMDEILQLKLNADWVVLSACNTAAGAREESGMELASGLGRAFFFAGTRALLVTGWSVHSASARDLVSDLFRRQEADVALDRARALQQAMNHLIDAGGLTDPSGRLSASYAHPVFWAPYMLIGDGGHTR
jgi:CHAT domain-containing protein